MAKQKPSKSGSNVQNEIQRMVEYIEEDGLEKVEEIDLKTEDEFQIEKNKHRDKEIVLLTQYYDRLEEEVDKNSKAESCRIIHRSRLKFLHAQQEVLDEVRKTAKERLKNVHCEENKDAYIKILTALILQGLLKILESFVIVRFSEQDKNFIDDCIEKAADSFKKKTNIEVEIEKSDEHLPENYIGGVILIAKNNAIMVDNTLEFRMYVVADKADSAILPEYRNILFGKNPNRKHFD